MYSSDYYGDTFFKSAGTQLSPYVIQVILGGVSVAGTIPCMVCVFYMNGFQSTSSQKISTSLRERVVGGFSLSVLFGKRRARSLSVDIHTLNIHWLTYNRLESVVTSHWHQQVHLKTY